MKLKQLHTPPAPRRAGFTVPQAIQEVQKYYYHDWKVKMRDLVQMPSGSMRLNMLWGFVTAKIMGVKDAKAYMFLRNMADVHCQSYTKDQLDKMFAWAHSGFYEFTHLEHVSNFEESFFHEAHDEGEDMCSQFCSEDDWFL